MKTYVYFVSLSFVRTDGTTGNGMGERFLNEPITTFAQLMALADGVKNDDKSIKGVTILNFILLRSEDKVEDVNRN